MVEPLLLALDRIVIGKRERAFQAARMLELKLNIEDVGLIHPITVTTDGQSDRYLLVAGRHRLEAFRQLEAEGHLDYAQIPALEIRPEEALKVELCENLYRADLTVLEKAEHLVVYLRETTDTVSEAIAALARMAKQSARTFYRYKAIGEGIRISEEIKQLDGDLVNSTNQLYYLAKKCPLRSTQVDILELLIQTPGLTIQDAHSQLLHEVSGKAREKLVPLQVPLSFRERVGNLSKQNKMNKREFTEKFLSAALAAFEQGEFEIQNKSQE